MQVRSYISFFFLSLYFSLQYICCLSPSVRPSPAPSEPPGPLGITPLGVNMVVVLGISLCLAVILSTVVVTVWRRFCQTPQCSSVHRGSMHSPGGRKLSDEASICGKSLQRPSLSDGHGTLEGTGVSVAQETTPGHHNGPVSQTLVIPLSQDPERLSPTGQKMLPTVFGYVKIIKSLLKFDCIADKSKYYSPGTDWLSSS